VINLSDDINSDSDDFFGIQSKDDESTREAISLMERNGLQCVKSFKISGFAKVSRRVMKKIHEVSFLDSYHRHLGLLKTGSMFGRICANSVIRCKSSKKSKKGTILLGGEGDDDQLHISATAGRHDAARIIHEFFTKMLQRSEDTEINEIQRKLVDSGHTLPKKTHHHRQCPSTRSQHSSQYLLLRTDTWQLPMCLGLTFTQTWMKSLSSS